MPVPPFAIFPGGTLPATRPADFLCGLPPHPYPAPHPYTPPTPLHPTPFYYGLPETLLACHYLVTLLLPACAFLPAHARFIVVDWVVIVVVPLGGPATPTHIF